MIYTVDQDENKKINPSQTNEQINVNNRPQGQLKHFSSRCILFFAIISISIIVLCSIFMAIMTTSVFIKTNNLNQDIYLRNKDIELFLQNNTDPSNDPNKLERNVFGWIRDSFKKSFLKKGSNSNKYKEKN